MNLIEGATMKAIRVIRNVGFVPELPESLPRREPLEEILHSWQPEVSSDGSTWTAVAEHGVELMQLFHAMEQLGQLLLEFALVNACERMARAA